MLLLPASPAYVIRRYKSRAGHRARVWMRANRPDDPCAWCRASWTRTVHHKDGNVFNEQPENFEWLCRGCHDLHHGFRTRLAAASVRRLLRMAATPRGRKIILAHPELSDIVNISNITTMSNS